MSSGSVSKKHTNLSVASPIHTFIIFMLGKLCGLPLPHSFPPSAWLLWGQLLFNTWPSASSHSWLANQNMSLWFSVVELRESNQSHYSCVKIEHIKPENLSWPSFLSRGLSSKERKPICTQMMGMTKVHREIRSQEIESSALHTSPAAIFPGVQPHPCESATSHSAAQALASVACLLK